MYAILIWMQILLILWNA